MATRTLEASGDVLERIERRLERLEATLARLEVGAPAAVSAMVDTLDDAADALQTRGVDQRLRETLSLLERMTAPEVTASLQRALALASALPELTAAAVDTADDVVDGLRERGIDLDDRLGTLARVMDKPTQPAALAVVSSLLDQVEHVRFLLDSGVFEPAAVRVVSELGQSLAAASQKTPPRVGAFGALRAASDPDVQRAIGFMLTLARSFGASLHDLEDRPQLTRGSEE